MRSSDSGDWTLVGRQRNCRVLARRQGIVRGLGITGCSYREAVSPLRRDESAARTACAGETLNPRSRSRAGAKLRAQRLNSCWQAKELWGGVPAGRMVRNLRVQCCWGRKSCRVAVRRGGSVRNLGMPCCRAIGMQAHRCSSDESAARSAGCRCGKIASLVPCRAHHAWPR